MLDKVINKAKHYLGYLEKKSNRDLEDFTANAGYNNYTIFAKLYKDYTGANYQGQAWCAMFVSCVFTMALGLETAKRLLCGKLYAYCPYGMAAFKAKGQLYTKPKAGDIVFYLRSSGVAYHTGIVTRVSGNTIYTIEGNTSGASGVVANGGGVCAKAYKITSAMRFGRPKYESEKTTNLDSKWVKDLQAAIKVTVDGVAGAKTLAACPELKKGDTGKVVKLLQERLTDLDIKVSGGCDGDFGAGTLAAVKTYQKAKKITADGIVGRNTWTALLEL